MRTSARLIVALGLLAALAGCDKPASRMVKRAAPPTAAADADTPIDTITLAKVDDPTNKFPDDPASPILWNPHKSAFEFNGQPLRAEKLWTFDGATDGFVVADGEVLPADGAGLSVRIGGRDAILRTPRGLNVAGANRSLLLVRLTRTGAAKRLDPTVYYSTKGHGESPAYFAKPAFGGHPRLNDTVVMVFNMHRPAVGGDDWRDSIIDQVRLDMDDDRGGAFVVHQVAIAQDPGGIFPAPPPKPKDAETSKDGEKAKGEPEKPKAEAKPAKPKTSAK